MFMVNAYNYIHKNIKVRCRYKERPHGPTVTEVYSQLRGIIAHPYHCGDN